MLKTKRKNFSEDEMETTKKRIKPKIKLEDAPPVKSIKDLIEIGKSIKFYKNIDTVMLWRITPYLEELDKMIGMKSLKETIFYQIIYYLQGMHTKNSQEYLHTAIYGPPGCGKCLAKDTPVMLFDGSYKMSQDININDILMGDDSTPRNVLSICTGRETMYEIQQKNGDNYTVNESHILSLKLAVSPKIKDNGDSFIIKWYSYDCANSKIFRYKQETKTQIKNTCKQFLLTLPKKHSVIDISVKDYLSRSLDWKNAFRGYKVILDFENNNFENIAYSFGTEIGKGIKTFIPKEYKISNRNTRLNLLAGILDTESDKKNYTIFPKTEKVAKDIIWIVRSLGFRATYKNSCISFSGKTGDIPCEIPRSFINLKTSLQGKINIKKLSENDYFGFEIDGNRRFLLSDFTVTHNTSVAKIIAKIYQGMNILSPNGNFRIAYRDDFIAGYLGQSAGKTKKLLNSCIGGVLFIDEAYSLAPRKSDGDSFAKEVIDTLNGFLSEHKNDFCCIIAGYENDIVNCLFKMNDGLERRFPWIHRIESYSAKNLCDIFMKMISEIKWDIAFEQKILIDMFSENKEYFKNAGGDIETFLTKCKMFHSKRVFSLGKEHKFILTKEDIYEALEYIKKNNTRESEEWRNQFV